MDALISAKDKTVRIGEIRSQVPWLGFIIVLYILMGAAAEEDRVCEPPYQAHTSAVVARLACSAANKHWCVISPII